MNRIFLTLSASKSAERCQILDLHQSKLLDKIPRLFSFLVLYNAIVLNASIRNSARLGLSRNVETRVTINFSVKLGMTPTQTYGKMTAANMNYKVSRRLIFKWHKRFRDGRESL